MAMKKLLVFLLMAVLLLFSCFSAVQDNKAAGHRISGYINASYQEEGSNEVTIEPTVHLDIVSKTDILSAVDGQYYGINLDYTDDSNPYRFLIAPTTTALSTPGLEIGTLSAFLTLSQGHSAVLTVVHDRLRNSNSDYSNVTVDYELSLVYSINMGSGEDAISGSRFCLGLDHLTTPLSQIDSNRKMIVDIPYASVISIHDAGIYFRMNKDSSVFVPGQYSSSVVFELSVL